MINYSPVPKGCFWQAQDRITVWAIDIGTASVAAHEISCRRGMDILPTRLGITSS